MRRSLEAKSEKVAKQLGSEAAKFFEVEKTLQLLSLFSSM